MGSWLSYGLGSDNENLPAFCVLVTAGQAGQPLYARLWGSGFLPATFQGVRFLPTAEAVSFLKNPDGISPQARRKFLDRLAELHQARTGRRRSIPKSTSGSRSTRWPTGCRRACPRSPTSAANPKVVLEMYGPDVKTPGTFAANCLLARRLIERGVRFVQLFHQDWDHHGGLPGGIRVECRQTDQPTAALDQRPENARSA